MTAEVTELPHLVVVERLLGLPVIESALTKSAETYFKVKNLNHLVNWAFTTAETSLSTAKKQAIPIAMPIARRLETPINFVDDTLCWGLDKIEARVPIMKEKPEQILESAYALAVQTIVPAISNLSYVNSLIVEQAMNLRDTSHKKTNEILDTYYGNVTVKGIDNTAIFIDKLIDKYFPSIDEKEKAIKMTPEEDKLLHIIQTIGHLSAKAARRVYVNVKYHLSILKKDYLMPYIIALVEFLHLTNRLNTAAHTADKKVQTHSDEKTEESRENGESKKEN